MNRAEKIKVLYEKCGSLIEVSRKIKYLKGIPSRTISLGWISIDDKNSYWSLLLTSDKDTHNPLCGSAIGIDIRKDNGEINQNNNTSGVWKSALSMWPVPESTKEFNEISQQMMAIIDLAYAQYLAKPE